MHFSSSTFSLKRFAPGHQAEQRPERADVAAPEPLPQEVEQQDAEEDQPDQEALLERGVEGQRLDDLGQLVAERLELDGRRRSR